MIKRINCMYFLESTTRATFQIIKGHVGRPWEYLLWENRRYMCNRRPDRDRSSKGLIEMNNNDNYYKIWMYRQDSKLTIIILELSH